MNIVIKKEVQEIIDIIERNGYSAYIVGGAVRNQLLGIPVKDWDLTTNAKPNTIQEIFEKNNIITIPTGIEHGTITVCYEGLNIEVTTYRIDGNYSDGRRPDSVEFVNNLKEDLARRDFTINALAYNRRTGIVDYFGGLKDLEDKKIRCVGSPKERFSEDALRMLRAIRFENTLDFDIEEKTLKSIYSSLKQIANVSMERVQQELNKILSTKKEIKHFDTIIIMFPSLFKKKNMYRKIQECNLLIEEMQSNNFVRNLTTFFLYDIVNVDFLKQLKYSKSIVNAVMDTLECYKIIEEKYFLFLENDIGDIKYNIKQQLLSEFPDEIISNAIAIFQSRNNIMTKALLSTTSFLKIIKKNNEPVELKDLAINGDDLLRYGFQGTVIGDLLKSLLSYVWNCPEKNSKDLLLDFLGIGEEERDATKSKKNTKKNEDR